MKERIKVYLYNKTIKEIDMSDFSYLSEDIFSERGDIIKVILIKCGLFWKFRKI